MARRKQLTEVGLAKRINVSVFAINFLWQAKDAKWMKCIHFHDVGMAKALSHLGLAEYEEGDTKLTPGKWRLTTKGIEELSQLKDWPTEQTDE